MLNLSVCYSRWGDVDDQSCNCSPLDAGTTRSLTTLGLSSTPCTSSCTDTVTGSFSSLGSSSAPCTRSYTTILGSSSAACCSSYTDTVTGSCTSSHIDTATSSLHQAWHQEWYHGNIHPRPLQLSYEGNVCEYMAELLYFYVPSALLLLILLGFSFKNCLNVLPKIFKPVERARYVSSCEVKVWQSRDGMLLIQRMAAWRLLPGG
jgi:hypothetical protein